MRYSLYNLLKMDFCLGDIDKMIRAGVVIPSNKNGKTLYKLNLPEQPQIEEEETYEKYRR